MSAFIKGILSAPEKVLHIIVEITYFVQSLCITKDTLYVTNKKSITSQYLALLTDIPQCLKMKKTGGLSFIQLTQIMLKEIFQKKLHEVSIE